MKIQFYYFDGCPSYISALKNLKYVLKSENIDTHIEVIKVDSIDEAKIFFFQGSPSIKINGFDLEEKTDDYNFTCRLYEIDGKLTGIPTKKYIKTRLKKIIDSP